jgi:phospholipid/cholesterol/gamma-HCH transport system substrate-binding protein
MRRLDLELTAGLFILAGIICLAYLSVKLGKMEFFGGPGYEIHASFADIGGLRTGSVVEIAGVEVGRVKRITLEDYQARVVMRLSQHIEIQEDSLAAIKTKGLIGEKYVEITPGGAEEIIQPGESIIDTQPSVDIEELISKYVFGKVD